MSDFTTESLLARIVRLRREREALDPRCAVERRERLESELRLAECAQLDLDIQSYLAGDNRRPAAQVEEPLNRPLTSAEALAAMASFLLRKSGQDHSLISQYPTHL